MKRMRASAFKAQCLKIMKDVKDTGEPVVVTKRGVPLVNVIPAVSEPESLFGFLAGELRILGDVESPAVPLKDWKVMRK